MPEMACHLGGDSWRLGIRFLSGRILSQSGHQTRFNPAADEYLFPRGSAEPSINRYAW